MIGKILISLIRLYKMLVSPVLPSTCRYYPSCSTYAILAIEKYGALKGGLKAAFRVLRCNPLSKGGIDYP